VKRGEYYEGSKFKSTVEGFLSKGDQGASGKEVSVQGSGEGKL